MANSADEPLVYTKLGNLPVKDLEFYHYWEQSPEWTKLTLGYKLNGEVVKESCHVLAKNGLAMFPEAGSF